MDEILIRDPSIQKADILITLSLEEKVRLEGFQYPNYEEDADLTQQEIEELRRKDLYYLYTKPQICCTENIAITG